MRTLNERPCAVTVISWIFLGAGLIGLAYHATEFGGVGAPPYEVAWVCLVRLLAVVSAVFMLRGSNWARWLLIVWIAYHVILSAFHSLFQTVVHALLLGVVAYFLFNAKASVSAGSENQPPVGESNPAILR